MFVGNKIIFVTPLRSRAALQGFRLSTRKDEESETGVITATKRQTRLKRPRLYKVLLHNDDYTPRSFVVMLLTNIFGKSESDASAIMLQAHNTGISVAGVYSFAIAETKVAEVLAAADKAGFPLLCTMEPEHDGEEGDDENTN